MTKHQELEILEETISRLGNDSYIGEWLNLNLGQIAADLHSDIIPDVPSLKAWHASARERLTETIDWERKVRDNLQKLIREEAEQLAQKLYAQKVWELKKEILSVFEK